jgi:hypothetical protein
MIVMKYAMFFPLLVFLSGPIEARLRPGDTKNCDVGDREACYRVYRENCKIGLGAYCDALANMEHTRGRTKEAEQLFRTGCDQRRLPACYGLGYLLVSTGRTVEGTAVYQESCRLGVGAACREAGKLLDAAQLTSFETECKNGTLATCLMVAYAKQASQKEEAKKLFIQVCEKVGSQSKGDFFLACLEASRLIQLPADAASYVQNESLCTPAGRVAMVALNKPVPPVPCPDRSAELSRLKTKYKNKPEVLFKLNHLFFF